MATDTPTTFDFERMRAEIPRDVHEFFEARQAQLRRFTDAVLPPVLQELREKEESGDVAFQDYPVWVKRLQSQSAAHAEKHLDPDGEIVTWLLDFMALPGVTKLIRLTFEELRQRAADAGQADPLARRLLDWLRTVYAQASAAERRAILAVVLRCNATKHETLGKAAYALRHLDVLDGDEEDDDDAATPDPHKAALAIHRVSMAFLHTFAELGELRYQAYVRFLWDVLAAAGITNLGRRKRISFGTAAREVEQALNEHYPEQDDLIDLRVHGLRNAVMHVTYEVDTDEAEVIVLDDSGAERDRIGIEELAERLHHLLNLVEDGGSWHRALEAITFAAMAEMLPTKFENAAEQVRAERHANRLVASSCATAIQES